MAPIGLSGTTLDTTARLVGIAGVLGTLTVLVYWLGVWRQEVENTRNNVGPRMHACLTRIERRLDRLERLERLHHTARRS